MYFIAQKRIRFFGVRPNASWLEIKDEQIDFTLNL
jgi:hypothetical protein